MANLTGCSTVEADEIYLYSKTPNKLLKLDENYEIVTVDTEVVNYNPRFTGQMTLNQANVTADTDVEFNGLNASTKMVLYNQCLNENLTDISIDFIKGSRTWASDAINDWRISNNLTESKLLFAVGKNGTTTDILKLGNDEITMFKPLIVTGITSTGVLQLPLGTTNVPALNFGDSNSGFYGQPDSIGITTGGSGRFRVDNTSTMMRSLRNILNTGGILQWNSSTYEVTYHRDIDVNNINVTGTVSGITKAMVGLSNVDNTTDLAKPISTLTQTALDLKANLASANTFTQTNIFKDIEVENIVSCLSRGIVINQKTPDRNNVYIGWNAGQNIASTQQGNVFIGERAGSHSTTPNTISQHNIAIGYGAGMDNNGTSGNIGIGYGVVCRGSNTICIGNSAHSNTTNNSIMLNASGSLTYSPTNGSFVVRPIRNLSTTSILQYNPTTFEVSHSSTLPSFTTTNITVTGTVSGISKTMVGLGNVDNTTDLAKPISTLTQNALDLKANLASPTFTGTVSGITKAMINLSNVDNTSDLGKPISTLTQNALDLKADLTTSALTNYYTQSQTLALNNLTNYTTTTALNSALNLKANSASPVFSGQSLFPQGSITIPSIAFSGDTNTGICSSSADVVNIVTGGFSRLQITNTGTMINNLTTTGVTSSGNISIISPLGNSEILIQTQNNLTSKLSLKELSQSYGMELIYNGTDNAFYIDALNLTRTTIFSTNILTYVSTFPRQVNFENNVSFPNNTSVLSMCGLSQPTNEVINPQFTFLHPTTKVNQKTGLSLYIDEVGSKPGLVLVSNGVAVAQAEATTGLTSYSQIRGKSSMSPPTFTFSDETDTGIGSDAANTIKIVCGGNTVAWLTDYQVRLISPAIFLDSTNTYFGTSGNIKITYNAVSGSGYDALNFYCQSKLRFQIVDNTSNIQECRFYGVTAQGNSYLSIIYWSDAHIYYRNSRNANDPTPKRHYFQAYDYQGLKSSFITPGQSTWNTFTGQHICAYEGIGEIKVGYIVASTGKINSMLEGENQSLKQAYGKEGITIDCSLPVVTYSSKMNQKSVMGVICELEPETTTRSMGIDLTVEFEKQDGIADRRLIINSLGEGAVWVANINGPLENGDYITSSSIPGIGQRQDCDNLKNYTVAKVTIDCNFNDPTAYEMKYIDITGDEITEDVYLYRKSLGYQHLYIMAFLPCTYHCG